MGIFKDLTDQQFDRLTVINYAGVTKNRHSIWECRCACGKSVEVEKPALMSGKTRSCGCLHAETSALNGKVGAKHSMSHTPTYKCWAGMLSRCNDPANESFHRYGGRGITVCERWKDFSNFLADMGARPEGHQIDRFPNNDGNYEPGNCRWATSEQNANNRSNSILFDHDGEQLSIPQIARKEGISERKLRYQVIGRGLSVKQALNEFTKHFQN